MNMDVKEKLDGAMPEQASIPVAQIDVGERLRTIDPDYAAMIAARA